jgi:hypothetical protein
MTFGGTDLRFWYNNNYALGQKTNGYTNVGGSFEQPDEGPYALNNGEMNGFVFTSFHILLVKPTGRYGQSFYHLS